MGTAAGARRRCRNGLARRGALLALIAAAPLAAQTVPPADTPIGRFTGLLDSLAAGADGDLVVTEDLAACDRAVVDAIARARRNVPARHHIWFEVRLGEQLVRMRGHDQVRKALEALYAEQDQPPAAVDTTAWAYADGLRLLAELQLRDGARDEAIASARRAQRAADRRANRTLQAWFDSALANALDVEVTALLDLQQLGPAYERLQRQRVIVQKLHGDALESADSRLRLRMSTYYELQDCFGAAAAVWRDSPTAQAPLQQLFVDTLTLHNAEERGQPDPATENKLRALLEQDREHTIENGFVEGALTVLVRAAIADGRLDVAREDLAHMRRIAGSGRPIAAEIAMLETRVALADTITTPPQLHEQLRKHRDAFEALLADWSRVEPHPGGIGFLGKSSRRRILTEYVRLTRALYCDAVADRCAAESLIRLQCLTSPSRLLHADDVGLDEVCRTFVGPGRGVIALLTEPAQSLLLLLDADGPHTYALPGSGELTAKAQALRDAFDATSDAVGEEDRKEGGEHVRGRAAALADALLPAAARQRVLRWKEATVSDYGSLGGLPWECLAIEGQLLGERVALTALTSLPLGVKLAHAVAAPLPRGRAALTLVANLSRPGAMKVKAGVDSGPAAVAFERELRGIYADVAATVGDDVTPRRFAALDLRAPVTQILTHGNLLEASNQTVLAMTPDDADPDGYFDCTEAASLHVQGVVIVSACLAACSGRRIGEEPMVGTLGGSFLLAGADTVVQSAANLHLRAHVELLRQFHQALVDGATVAESLRLARAALAKDADLLTRFEHARVQVCGLGHRVVFAR